MVRDFGDGDADQAALGSRVRGDVLFLVKELPGACAFLGVGVRVGVRDVVAQTRVFSVGRLGSDDDGPVVRVAVKGAAEGR